MTVTVCKYRGCLLLAMLVALVATGASCGTKQTATDNQNTQPSQVSQVVKPQPVDPFLLERVKREKWSGDLDGMVERRFIRALVTFNRSYYKTNHAASPSASFLTANDSAFRRIITAVKSSCCLVPRQKFITLARSLAITSSDG